MPTVTALKAQKKNRQRVNVYLNGEFAFGLDLENVLRSGLKVGKELTDDEVAYIVKQGDYQKILDGALKYVNLRPRSEMEFNQWLVKKQAEPTVREQVTGKLRSLGYLNDQEFAKWWIEQRQVFKPRGKRLLQQELLQKGLDRKLIEEILKYLPSEDQGLRQLAERRIRLIRATNNLERKKKLTDYLLRKGYSYGEIRPVVDELVGKRVE